MKFHRGFSHFHHIAHFLYHFDHGVWLSDPTRVT
jgi:hypothetical protein